jgi:hypothetical protein
LRAGRNRQAQGVAGLALAALVAGVVWIARADDDGGSSRTAQETVNAFYAAQRDGNCGRLIGLLAEKSWSDDGHRTRAEFLDQCEEVLDRFELRVDPAGRHVEDDLPDDEAPGRARVEVSSIDVAGVLVWEDDAWKVVTDPRVLYIGRSVEDTVRGYTEAFDAGDCVVMLDHLSEAAWSEGGTLDREAFLDDCGDEADRRVASAEKPLQILHLEVAVDDDGSAIAAVAFDENVLGDSDDVVTLVREGLEWKLDENRTRPAHVPGPPLVQVQYAEMRSRLLDGATGRDGRTCGIGRDVPAPEVGDADPGVLRGFVPCGLAIRIYEAADRQAAGALADELAAQVAGEAIPTADDLAAGRARNGLPAVPIEDLRAYVDTLHPNQRVIVPGFAAAHGVLTSCRTEGCDGSAATAANGNYVVMVEYAMADLTLTGRMLEAQVAQL